MLELWTNFRNGPRQGHSQHGSKGRRVRCGIFSSLRMVYENIVTMDWDKALTLANLQETHNAVFNDHESLETLLNGREGGIT